MQVVSGKLEPQCPNPGIPENLEKFFSNIEKKDFPEVFQNMKEIYLRTNNREAKVIRTTKGKIVEGNK